MCHKSSAVTIQGAAFNQVNRICMQNSGVMWILAKQTLQLCMAAIVSIASRHGVAIEECRRNQLNKSKLALYNPLLSLQQLIKQLYISNKTGHFSY